MDLCLLSLRLVRRALPVVALGLAACSSNPTAEPSNDAAVDAKPEAAKPPPSGADGGKKDASKDAVADATPGLAIPASCAGMTAPPRTLECTGLYTDLKEHTLVSVVEAYAPAVPLWADGSGKDRWIYLPPGTTIDRTNPSEWTFPVGTRVWKQFSRAGKRIETRFFEKKAVGFWAYGTYAWNADETEATLSPGGDITLANGDAYHIPTVSECAECHNGRRDRLLGFEEVSLGLTGATGLTLGELAKGHWLAPEPKETHLDVGDDGTGQAAAPLSWLHINCGVSCHNTDPGATAYSLGMILKLDPAGLDGRAVNGFPSLVTTVGVAAKSPAFRGATRIAPGDAKASLLHELIDERGGIQMPPIASLLVDTPDVAAIASWISAMPKAGPVDAGTDAPVDAGYEAASEAGLDAASDAVVVDATPDAGAIDAADARGATGDAKNEAASADGDTDGALDAATDGGAG